MRGLPYSHGISRAFAGGITQSAYEKNLQRLEAALAGLREAYEKKTLAHLRLPERTDDLVAINALAAKLRERAERNHRSLQGELMAILEAASGEARAAAAPADGLLERLLAITGSRGIDTAKRLTRERAHDRKRLRKSGA